MSDKKPYQGLKKTALILAFGAVAAFAGHFTGAAQAVVSKSDVEDKDLTEVFEQLSTYAQEAKDIEIKSVNVDFTDKSKVKPAITINDLTPEV